MTKTLLCLMCLLGQTQAQPPTELEPGILQNYEYVHEHRDGWRNAETQFKEQLVSWQSGKLCGPQFFAIADQCSPKFQMGLPDNLIEKMRDAGWQPLYWELKPLPDEGLSPYCNDPECGWCIAHCSNHAVKILARVEQQKIRYASRTWSSRTEVRGFLVPIPVPSLFPEPENGANLENKLEPAPRFRSRSRFRLQEPLHIEPATPEPQEVVPPRTSKGKTAMLAGYKADAQTCRSKTRTIHTPHGHRVHHSHHGPGHHVHHNHKTTYFQDSSGKLYGVTTGQTTVINR